jgi:hypothetical protein
VIKRDEMSGTCSTNGGNEKCVHNLGLEISREEHFGDLDVLGKIILKLIFEGVD